MQCINSSDVNDGLIHYKFVFVNAKMTSRNKNNCITNMKGLNCTSYFEFFIVTLWELW